MWSTHGNGKVYKASHPSSFVYTMDAISYNLANPADVNFYQNYRHDDLPMIGWMDGHASRAPDNLDERESTGAPQWHSYYTYFYP